MIKPLEESEPLLAELIMDVANKRYGYNVKAIYQRGPELICIPYKQYNAKRNEPCVCGSGKKAKKCYCRILFD